MKSMTAWAIDLMVLVLMRNHVAKVLWTPKFRPKVTKNPKAYTRKVKHKVKYA